MTHAHAATHAHTHAHPPTHGHATARQRNLALERLAHALPYLLFAAALLLLDSIGRGATQAEFFKGMQDGMNNGAGGDGITARGLTMFCGAVGLVVALALLNQKLKGRPARAKSAPRAARAPSKSPSLNQPRKLLKEVAKAAGLSRDELRQLKVVAEQNRHDSPLTLLLCPSLLIDAARKDDTGADKAVLARLARKVVG